MANVYDQQFKDRVAMHMLVCDPASENIIFHLRQYLDRAQAENERLRRIEQLAQAVVDAAPGAEDCDCETCQLRAALRTGKDGQ